MSVFGIFNDDLILLYQWHYISIAYWLETHRHQKNNVNNGLKVKTTSRYLSMCLHTNIKVRSVFLMPFNVKKGFLLGKVLSSMKLVVLLTFFINYPSKSSKVYCETVNISQGNTKFTRNHKGKKQ